VSLKVSPRHALSPEEFDFVKIYCAFGETNAAEAYRRAFCLQIGGYTFEKNPGTGKALSEDPTDALSPATCSKRATALLKQAHVAEFILELKRNVGDHARDVLADQVLFSSDEGVRAKAAARVLDDEDKLGFREASELHAEILSAIGTEVVVPLPNGKEVTFPAREMFPSFSDALPPPDVLWKTMQSLDQYLWMELGRAKDEQRDARDWKFPAGADEYRASQRSRRA
jgi:hypothetical protein